MTTCWRTGAAPLLAVTLLAGCVAQPSPRSAILISDVPPLVMRADQTDLDHSVAVADLYRWMAGVDSMRVKTVVAAENADTTTRLESLPLLEALPRRRAGRWHDPQIGASLSGGSPFMVPTGQAGWLVSP